MIHFSVIISCMSQNWIPSGWRDIKNCLEPCHFAWKIGNSSIIIFFHAPTQSIFVMAVECIGQFNSKHLHQSTCCWKLIFYKGASEFSSFKLIIDFQCIAQQLHINLYKLYNITFLDILLVSTIFIRNPFHIQNHFSLEELDDGGKSRFGRNILNGWIQT